MSRTALRPTVLVILGATGDLTSRKIIPALANLFEKDALPKKFKVLGFARRELADESFQEHVSKTLGDRKENPGTKFLELFGYQAGSFEKEEDYAALAERLRKIDKEWGVRSNKLFYLAVSPDFHEVIATQLAKSGLILTGGDRSSTRVIVEKPFGTDGATAEKLDRLLATLFKEVQIYRIDHYLGKEMMQNMLTFRFANNLFESSWNNRHIESIAVRFFEKIGIEGRGDFYDHAGALRDVGQNHLLQMLALTTMENPVDLEAVAVRRKKAELLAMLRKFTPQDVATHSIRAQYEGYHKEKGVAPKSQSETYFKIEAFLDSPRWQGVPITLEAGKFMPEVRKEIEVVFRHTASCLCPPGKHYKNSLVFQMEPEESITVRFWAKGSGPEVTKIEKRDFEFPLEGKPAPKGRQAYEKILLDCILGDQMLFVGSKEIAASWRFIDSISDGWEKNLAPLQSYKPGESLPAFSTEEDTSGPEIPKTLGMIGLGKMGGSLARQLMEKSWRIVGWNRSPEVTQELATKGMVPAESIDDLLAKLESPRVVWLMVPAGKPVDDLLFGKDGIAKKLKKGDIVIDGGNSFYKDSIRRGKLMKRQGLHFLDAGVSGGPGGARYGATVMVGGDRKIYDRLTPLFRDMSVAEGYAHIGDTGAGHFVKMVHNGIEYGMMQSLAEGFAVIKKSRFKPDLRELARLYNHGSVIESRLVGWLERGFAAWGDDLRQVSGTVDSTGEGEWTVKTAKELGIAAPAIEDAFKFRMRSKRSPSYTGKILSALRNQFGGHAYGNDKDKDKDKPKK